MLEFESKRKLKKRVYSKFTLVVLLVILVLVAHGAWGIFQKKRIVSEDLRKTQETLEQFNERKAKLESKLDRVNSDVGKEEILRDKYSVAKEGEKAIFILDSDEEEEVILKEEGFFKKLFGGLFN
jgi:cell division protein FtsB